MSPKSTLPSTLFDIAESHLRGVGLSGSPRNVGSSPALGILLNTRRDDDGIA